MEVTSFKNKIIIALLWILFYTIISFGATTMALFILLAIVSIYIQYLIMSLAFISISIIIWFGINNLSFMVLQRIMEY